MSEQNRQEEAATGISPLMGEKCSQGRLLPLALPLTKWNAAQ